MKNIYELFFMNFWSSLEACAFQSIDCNNNCVQNYELLFIHAQGKD
jgi:hypothetical protein